MQKYCMMAVNISKMRKGQYFACYCCKRKGKKLLLTKKRSFAKKRNVGQFGAVAPVREKRGNVMNQSAVWADETDTTAGRWSFSKAVEAEHSRQRFIEERRKLAEERREFEREKKEFSLQKNIEDRRIETERHLFEMKWKLLEEEVKKLASEKAQVERQRDFYKRVNSFNQKQEETGSNIIHGAMFFVGVESEQSLKKRYKDLIKIYHPDNLSGDTGALQEINREYDKLKQHYEEN